MLPYTRPYGSVVDPLDAGSGGGGGDENIWGLTGNGGNGGGVIKITVVGTFSHEVIGREGRSERNREVKSSWGGIFWSVLRKSVVERACCSGSAAKEMGCEIGKGGGIGKSVGRNFMVGQPF